MNTKLSIIIPFYGNANKALLDRCLKSIKEQRIEPDEYEIIIADDNGKGLGGARNNGIQKAQGKYLLFIDADDCLLPNTIHKCIELINANIPDILSFEMKRLNNNKVLNIQSHFKYTIYPSGAEYMNKHNFTGSACRHLFKKELILKHSLFFAEGKYHEDEDFVAKAYFYANQTIIMHYQVYGYYLQEQSITLTCTKEARLKRVKDFHEMLLRIYKLKQEQTSAPLVQQKALERRFNFLIIDFLRQLIRNKCSALYIREQIKELIQENILPLSNQKYSWRYYIVSNIINFITTR